ncbi:PREDICTED: protein FLC EXPRESSOR-like isoform X2 [Populus euphratica]|uniref:Protein FLC EXPRESSOR-like isoform X2 n=1 Tax=Populus euphratica TaxID=75702 RepID=A0AAJ6T2J6_POPEU|nr:PREDICTED: protein FLC EXPRESSOR-like isoform X2 [Populus euphratica]
MAGRNHLQLREIPLSRVAPLSRSTTGPRHLHTRPHRHLLEDRISTQHREIQSLLLDNHRHAATRCIKTRSLSVTARPLRHLSTLAAGVKAERDNQIREVYQRSLKLDAELRSIDAMSAELVQVRTDVQKITLQRQDMTAQLKDMNSEIVKAKRETQQVGVIKEEIEIVQQEIQGGRSAIEYEKKTWAFNLEQEKVLDKNRILLVREIEKLRTELANAEKRARAAAASGNPSPGYGRNYGSAEVRYGGSSYPDPNGLHHVRIGGVILLLHFHLEQCLMATMTLHIDEFLSP